MIMAFTMVVCEKIDLETQINEEYVCGGISVCPVKFDPGWQLNVNFAQLVEH